MSTFTIEELEQIQALITINKGLHEKVTNMISDANSCQEVLYKFYYRDWETDRKSTRLNSSHSAKSRMPSSA